MFLSIFNVVNILDVDQEEDTGCNSKQFIGPDYTKDLMVNNTAIQEHSLYIASDDVGSYTSSASTGNVAVTPSVGGSKDVQKALNSNHFIVVIFFISLAIIDVHFSWIYELGLSISSSHG